MSCSALQDSWVNVSGVSTLSGGLGASAGVNSIQFQNSGSPTAFSSIGNVVVNVSSVAFGYAAPFLRVTTANPSSVVLSYNPSAIVSALQTPALSTVSGVVSLTSPTSTIQIGGSQSTLTLDLNLGTRSGKAIIPVGQSTVAVTNNSVTAGAVVLISGQSPSDATATQFTAIATPSTVTINSNVGATAATTVDYFISQY